MVKVITYGTYDLLHYGHIRLLERAKALGDYLIVGVSSDEWIRKFKETEPIVPFEERRAIVEACRYVDDALIVDRSWGPHAYEESAVNDFMEKDKLDAAFVAADDLEYVKYWFGHLYKQDRVVIVPRTQGISTTQVIKIVNGDVVSH